MDIKSKGRLQQLLTGVHLVTVAGAELIKEEGQPAVSESNEMGLRVRFVDSSGKIYDKDYWLGGNRQFEFDNMCQAAKIDQSNPKFKAESRGKRVWICIKEVWKIDGTETVMNAFGEPDIFHQIFKYLPFQDNGKKPIVPGDPENNGGQADGDFIDSIDVKDTTAEVKAPDKPEPPKQEVVDDYSDF